MEYFPIRNTALASVVVHADGNFPVSVYLMMQVIFIFFTV